MAPALAFKTLARRTPLVLARLANRRAFGWRCRRHAFGRRIGAGFVEIIVALAPSAPVPPLFCGGVGVTLGGDRLRALRRAGLWTMTVTIVTRPALVGAATGPPDLDHLRRRDRLGRRHSRVRRRGLGDGNSLCGCLSGSLILRRFRRWSFDRSRRFRLDFTGFDFDGRRFVRSCRR